MARSSLALCAVMFLAGCESPTSPSTPRVVRVADAWVTGAAASAVDPATRLFVLNAGSAPVLTRAGADSAALAFARFMLHPGTFGNGRSSLETDRGATISAWSDLRLCGRALWVRTPFGAALTPAPRNMVRLMSSAWAHTLCGPRGDPEVAVHTADVWTGVRYVGADYRIEDLDSIGQVHHATGIPLIGWGPAPWPAPEAALQALFARTGVPISEVPEARVYWNPIPTVAWRPVWRFRLSSPVEAELDDGSIRSALLDIYALLASEDSILFFVPAVEQPSHVWVPHPVSIEPFILDSIQFPVLLPIALQRARPR